MMQLSQVSSRYSKEEERADKYIFYFSMKTYVVCTVNVLKFSNTLFQTSLASSLLFMQCFFKYLVEWQTV